MVDPNKYIEDSGCQVSHYPERKLAKISIGNTS